MLKLSRRHSNAEVSLRSRLLANEKIRDKTQPAMLAPAMQQMETKTKKNETKK